MTKIRLTEEQVGELITERASSKIYHFTSIRNALKIAEEDTIYLQCSLGSYGDMSYSYKKPYYLSTTRTRYQSFGYSRSFSDNSVRIELDGDKLNQMFNAKPFNYWGDIGKRYYYNNYKTGLNKDNQEHVRDEAEDRLYSSHSSIQGAHQVIKRIDVILTDLSENNFNNYINTRNLLLSKFAQRIYVYDNLKDFNYQTDNTINNEIIEDIDNFGKGTLNRYHEIYPSNAVINVVLAAILSGESDNPQRDSAKLLKKYNLESYIKGGILKNKNIYLEFPYTNYPNLANELSHTIANISHHPSNDKSKVMQMLSDYFRSHKLRNMSDFINYKALNTLSSAKYNVLDDLMKQGILDGEKTINMLLIKRVGTYDEIVVANPYEVKVKDINDNLSTIADNFIAATEDNMKSPTYSSYEKYIKRLFSKNPSLGNIIDILKKLGYQDTILETLEYVLDTSIREKNMNVCSLHDNMIMPQCLDDPKRSLSYYINLFKK